MERLLCAITLTLAVALASGYMVQRLPSLQRIGFPFVRLLVHSVAS